MSQGPCRFVPGKGGGAGVRRVHRQKFRAWIHEVDWEGYLCAYYSGSLFVETTEFPSTSFNFLTVKDNGSLISRHADLTSLTQTDVLIDRHGDNDRRANRHTNWQTNRENGRR